MSKASEILLDILRSELHGYSIIPEYYVRYKGRKLFIDYYIPGLCLAVECDGEQHFKYVSAWHKTIEKFKDSVYRDRLKDQWANENHITLIRLRGATEILDSEFGKKWFRSKIHHHIQGSN